MINKIILLIRKNIIVAYLLIIGSVLRIFNLDWDKGFFLHPDERLYINASNIHFPTNLLDIFSKNSPLNPHMFYYGSLPLYLYKFIDLLFVSSNLLITSRLISSFFSIATIPLIFLIAKNFSSKKASIISTFIFTFSAGSIQYAHFNTTESILTFLLASILLFSINFYKNPRYLTLIILGILCGFSYGTKITGIFFLYFPIISLLFFLKNTKKVNKFLLYVLHFVLFLVIASLVSAPYQAIDFRQFLNEQTYMQGVILGRTKPPFTIIYEGTIPYLYQSINVFPFIFGFISWPTAIIGGLIITKKLIKKHGNNNLYFLFIVLFPLFYFLWAGSWYAKFSRYYVLILPFLSIWAAQCIEKTSKIFRYLILVLIALNGVLLVKIYLFPNTRVQASEWIYNNIPSEKTILTEHWDDPLPLPLNPTKNYNIVQLPVYNPDTREKINILSNLIYSSDYFVISSRRVYSSILRNPKTYPATNDFYKLLFNGGLGFTKIYQVDNYPYFFTDDIADESFQSYDHPPILIFKNNKKLSSQKLFELISNKMVK